MTSLSPASTADEVVAHLRTLGSEKNREGKARYGINIDKVLGIPNPVQRDVAKIIKRDHKRAMALWESGISEARFVAGLTADPKLLTAADARRWAADFESWDLVDGVSDTFVDTDHWRSLIDEFADDEREFVRRTAYAMIAWAAVHRKKEPDETFLSLLPIIERHATDTRNYVKKAVNWALRQIGKRSLMLHGQAIELAERLAASDDRTARWNGKDALKELQDPKRIDQLREKAAKLAAKPRKG